jgi:hypothetical protein
VSGGSIEGGYDTGMMWVVDARVKPPVSRHGLDITVRDDLRLCQRFGCLRGDEMRPRGDIGYQYADDEEFAEGASMLASWIRVTRGNLYLDHGDMVDGPRFPGVDQLVFGNPCRVPVMDYGTLTGLPHWGAIVGVDDGIYTKEWFTRRIDRLGITPAMSEAGDHYETDPTILAELGREAMLVASTDEAILSAVHSIRERVPGCDCMVKYTLRPKTAGLARIAPDDTAMLGDAMGGEAERKPFDCADWLDIAYEDVHNRMGRDAAVLVQQYRRMHNEYRIYVCEGDVISGAGNIEPFVPKNSMHEPMDPQVQRNRSWHDPVVVDRPLMGRYLDFARGFVMRHPEYPDYTLDLCTYDDGTIGVVELNGLRNAGVYARDTDITVAGYMRHPNVWVPGDEPAPMPLSDQRPYIVTRYAPRQPEPLRRGTATDMRQTVEGIISGILEGGEPCSRSYSACLPSASAPSTSCTSSCTGNGER